MAVNGESKFKTPLMYVLASTEPENDAKSIVPLSLMKVVVVIAVNPSATVDPEKNPLSSASFETIPFINCTLLCWFKGNLKLSVWSNKKDEGQGWPSSGLRTFE